MDLQLRPLFLILLVLPLLLSAGCGPSPPEYGDDSWLHPAEACPSDVLSVTPKPLLPLPAGCDGIVEECWDSCWRGNATHCYLLALHEQESDNLDARAEALFLRSCGLGIDSGCTNRAAGIVTSYLTGGNISADQLNCANDTFTMVCERGDAWACMMLGLSYFRGIGVAVDYRRALEILPRACAKYPEDDACLSAMAVAEEAEKALSALEQ